MLADAVAELSTAAGSATKAPPSAGKPMLTTIATWSRIQEHKK
jgi:hypothetical protein